MNSRDKGQRGERELADKLREYGYEAARRGQQFRGSADSPDVVGLPGVHIECKWVESLNVHNAMDQARRDSDVSATPVVVHRVNPAMERNEKGQLQRRKDTCRGEWLVTLTLEDFIKFYKAWATLEAVL